MRKFGNSIKIGKIKTIWDEQASTCNVSLHKEITPTLSIPEAGETAETPVKRYCNIGKVPIRTQKRPYPVRNNYFLLGYIHVFYKGNNAFGGK